MKRVLSAITFISLVVALMYIVNLRTEITSSEQFNNVPPEVDTVGIITVDEHTDLEPTQNELESTCQDCRVVDVPVETECVTEEYNDAIPLDAELQTALFDSCDEYGIPYHIALGLIYTESSFDPYAISYTGCYGLCQLSPVYFPENLAPADNIRYGMKYLACQIAAYGSIEAGLTAYNAGHDTGNREYANAVISASSQWENIC